MELEVLKLPKQKIKQLEKKKIHSVEELAKFAPREYHDFQKPVLIDDLAFHEDVVAVCGTISTIKHYDKMSWGIVNDEQSHNVLSITCFNPYTRYQLTEGYEYIFFGKAKYNEKYDRYDMTPTFFSQDIEEHQRITPVYSKVQGMSTEYFNKCVSLALEALKGKCKDDIPKKLLKKLGICSLEEYLQALHYPKDYRDLDKVEKRQIVDVLYPLACAFTEKQKVSQQYKSSHIKVNTTVKTEEFIQSLPYELTQDQKNAATTLIDKIKKQERIETLLMGDVGSGKTVISEILAVTLAENGYQTAVMCPTSILAKQHYKEFSERLEKLGLKVVLLTSDMRVKEKLLAHKSIYTGDADVVIGTHAIISDNVEFANLGLTVVDEEHRFGVKQREKLKDKAKEGIHNLSMSATPIPRSLSIALYGPEVEIIDIKTKPNGRKDILTSLESNEKNVYQKIHEQVLQGHQVYVVCPLIEDSESEQMSEVDSVECTLEKLNKFFYHKPEVKIAAITGKMKEKDKEESISAFVNGDVNVLVATTIVEVGVNVPNATMIVIKNAERFGLAQLHQLRGRVGRSDLQSYCVLLSQSTDNERLNAMVQTSDGFEIAAADLELRGAGDIIGVKQSGFVDNLLLMMRHQELYNQICDYVRTN